MGAAEPRHTDERGLPQRPAVRLGRGVPASIVPALTCTAAACVPVIADVEPRRPLRGAGSVRCDGGQPLPAQSVARAAWPCYHVRDQFLNVHARGILGLLCQLEYSCILLNDRATYIHSAIPWWTAYVRRDLVCHDRHVICSARFVSVIRCTITACIRDTRIVNAVILTTPDSAVRFASAGDGLQLRGRSGADLSVRARKLPWIPSTL